MNTYLPVIAVLSPMLLGIVVYYVGGKSEKARDILSIATCVGSFLAVAAMAPAVLGGKVIEFVLVSGEIAPVEIAFRVDQLSLTIALMCYRCRVQGRHLSGACLAASGTPNSALSGERHTLRGAGQRGLLSHDTGNLRCVWSGPGGHDWPPRRSGDTRRIYHALWRGSGHQTD